MADFALNEYPTWVGVVNHPLYKLYVLVEREIRPINHHRVIATFDCLNARIEVRAVIEVNNKWDVRFLA